MVFADGVLFAGGDDCVVGVSEVAVWAVVVVGVAAVEVDVVDDDGGVWDGGRGDAWWEGVGVGW